MSGAFVTILEEIMGNKRKKLREKRQQEIAALLTSKKGSVTPTPPKAPEAKKKKDKRILYASVCDPKSFFAAAEMDDDRPYPIYGSTQPTGAKHGNSNA
jgi:hypothetical protein